MNLNSKFEMKPQSELGVETKLVSVVISKEDFGPPYGGLIVMTLLPFIRRPNCNDPPAIYGNHIASSRL